LAEHSWSILIYGKISLSPYTRRCGIFAKKRNTVESMEHILQECRMSSVLDSLGIKSQSAKDLFNEQSKRWTTNLKILEARGEAWRTLKQFKSPDWTAHVSPLLETLLGAYYYSIG
jgi:hypothetical protein